LEQKSVSPDQPEVLKTIHLLTPTSIRERLRGRKACYKLIINRHHLIDIGSLQHNLGNYGMPVVFGGSPRVGFLAGFIVPFR